MTPTSSPASRSLFTTAAPSSPEAPSTTTLMPASPLSLDVEDSGGELEASDKCGWQRFTVHVAGEGRLRAQLERVLALMIENVAMVNEVLRDHYAPRI